MAKGHNADKWQNSWKKQSTQIFLFFNVSGVLSHANVKFFEFERLKPKLLAIFSEFYLFDLDLTS